MENFTPYSALIGGTLIGLAATLLLLLNGQLAGISGIFRSATKFDSPDRLWRILFVIGLIVGGGIAWRVMGPTFALREGFSAPLLIVAGLLVGIGSNIGNGCTSGHGVCGIGRTSARSISATITFFSVALLTTFVIRQVFGGAA